MWLLLVAAGTGYLARCWQKARKPKPEAGRCRQIPRNRAIRRSPPCTPKRGRSSTIKGRGRRRRSNSVKAVGRRLIYDTREGGLTFFHTCDSGRKERNQPIENVVFGHKEFPGQVVEPSEEKHYLCQSEGKETEPSEAGSFLHDNMVLGIDYPGTADCMPDWEELCSSNFKSPVHSSINTGDFAGSTFPASCKCTSPDKNPRHGASLHNYSRMQKISLGRLLAKETASSAAWHAHSNGLDGGVCLLEDNGPCMTCSDQHDSPRLESHGRRIQQIIRGKKNLIVCSSSSDSGGGAIGTKEHGLGDCITSVRARGHLKHKQSSAESRESHCETLTQMHSSPVGIGVSNIQESQSVLSYERTEKRKSVASDHEALQCSGREQGIMDVGSSEESKENLFIHSDVEDTAKHLLKHRGLLQVGAGGKRMKDEGCGSGPGWTSGAFLFGLSEGSRCLSQMDSPQCLQQEGHEKSRADLSCKTKSLHKVPKVRGSLRRKLFLRASFKHIPSLENCPRVPEGKGVSNSRFLHSYLLQSLLDPECLVEHDNDDVHNFCTMEFSTSEEGIDGKRSTIPVTDLSTSNHETDSMSGLGLLGNKKKNDLTKPTNASRGAEESTRVAPPSMDKMSPGNCQETEKDCSSSKGGSLFGLGMGFGVMLIIAASRIEIENVGKLLKETESVVHDLRNQVDSRKALDLRRSYRVGLLDEELSQDAKLCEESDSAEKQPVRATVSSTGGTEKGPLENSSEVNESLRCIVTEEHMQGGDHMADLEAELEAELERMEQNMYSTESIEHQSKHSGFEELDLDNIAGLEHDDPIGYEFPVESESGDHDLYSDHDDTQDEVYDKVHDQVHDEAYESTFAVSPTELERRLWQVLEQRQEEKIFKLERNLRMTREKLFAKEKELQWWKDRVWWLMELSFGNKSGTHHPPGIFGETGTF